MGRPFSTMFEIVATYGLVILASARELRCHAVHTQVDRSER